MENAPRVVEAKATERYHVWVRFEDGLAVEIDFKDLIERGGFYGRPLRDPDFFRRVDIYPGGQGIFWPNEADVCPDALYSRAREAAGVAA